MTQIIQSLLDTDLYKFTMMQCILHHYPTTIVQYQFKCRTGENLVPYLAEITEELNKLANLAFTASELQFLAQLNYIKPDFIEFLRNFRLDPRLLTIGVAHDELYININGTWLDTILFEVPVLAIVNEIYYRHQNKNPDFTLARQLLHAKIHRLQQRTDLTGFMFSEFGTRRRFSHVWQTEVLKYLTQYAAEYFIGTSNVWLAKELQLLPIGTMAHEFLQAFQVLAPNIRDSQKLALTVWLEEYNEQLGIALTDVISMDAFLRDFDTYLANSYYGLRHDSGDPIIWGEKAIAHYLKLNIDPLTKTLVFSDSLTMPKAIAIFLHFRGRIRTTFGIGTNLTNDFGVPAMQIVIKMTRCNQQTVAKLSDAPNKTICTDLAYLARLKQIFAVE